MPTHGDGCATRVNVQRQHTLAKMLLQFRLTIPQSGPYSEYTARFHPDSQGQNQLGELSFLLPPLSIPTDP
jgi:hypothetical protein